MNLHFRSHTKIRSFSVTLGKNALNESEPRTEQQFRVDEIIIHEAFDDSEGNFNNDIGTNRMLHQWTCDDVKAVIFFVNVSQRCWSWRPNMGSVQRRAGQWSPSACQHLTSPSSQEEPVRSLDMGRRSRVRKTPNKTDLILQNLSHQLREFQTFMTSNRNHWSPYRGWAPDTFPLMLTTNLYLIF